MFVCILDDNLNLKYVLHFNTGIGLMLDCLVNALVIFMSFKFSSKMYDAVCSPITRMCQCCCSSLDMGHRDAKTLAKDMAMTEQKEATDKTQKTAGEAENQES